MDLRYRSTQGNPKIFDLNATARVWSKELGCIWHIFGKFGSFQALQHWQQPAAANKLSLVDSDVDSYLNIRIFQKEPKIA